MALCQSAPNSVWYPSEHSSGASVRRGDLTKAGNSAARRLLIEAAWRYRFPARVSRELLGGKLVDLIRANTTHGDTERSDGKPPYGGTRKDWLDVLLVTPSGFPHSDMTLY